MMKMTVRTRASLVLTALVAGFALGSPVAVAQGEPARGSISIEDQELTSPEPENEVKVGCDFRVDFFGFTTQEVPVRFTMMDPSGDGEQIEARVAYIEEAQGNELSGSLNVSLLDDLRGVEPAQAQDFDYKLRVDAVVKESEGTEVTKSAILFLDCDTSGQGTPAPVEEDTPAPGVAPQTPVGGVAAGMGGAADSEGFGTVFAGALALLVALAASVGVMRTRSSRR